MVNEVGKQSQSQNHPNKTIENWVKTKEANEDEG